MNRLLALPLLLLLAGCATSPGPASVSGTCSVFEAPRYAVKGARTYDQDWIDSTIEGGVGACKWQRPATRPAELDATPPPPRKAKLHAAPKKKKRPLWVRMLHWKKAAPVAAPVVASPPPIAEPVPPTPAAPPSSPPRSAIDELLRPSVQ